MASLMGRVWVAGWMIWLLAAHAPLIPAPAAAQSARTDRLVREESYLGDPALFAGAFEVLADRIGPDAGIRSITIEDKEIMATVAAGPGCLDRVSVRRARLLGLFARDLVSEPEPVQTPPAGFEAVLFRADDVALDALPDLMDRAIARAALEDPAHVSRIEIGAPEIVMPSPQFGRLRIVLTVASGREVAQIMADPSGTIVAADLSQTNRAQRLDLLAQDDWPMGEAQEALRTLAGPTAVIRTVEIGAKRITLRQDNATSPGVADFLTWDLSGARRNPIPTRNPADGRDFLPFSLADLDLTRLPEVKANALAAFGAPGTAITDITAKKTLSVRGADRSEVVWNLQVRFPGTPPSANGAFASLDEFGLVRVAADGTVLESRLPARLRPPPDWLTGRAIVDTLAEVRAALGPEARLQEVQLSRSGATVYFEDPAAPGTQAALVLDEDGLRRDPSPMTPRRRFEQAFPLAALDALGAEEVAALFDAAFERMPVDDRMLYRVSLLGSNGRLAPPGTPLLTVWDGKAYDPVTVNLATGVFMDGRE